MTPSAPAAEYPAYAHGKAVQGIRKYAKQKPTVGFAFATPCCTPTDNTPEAIAEAKQKSFAFTKDRFPFELSWWADPIFFGKYPEDAYKILGDDMPEIQEGDMEVISQPVDFYGGQWNVCEEPVSAFDHKGTLMGIQLLF